jgi:hypothetical protein
MEERKEIKRRDTEGGKTNKPETKVKETEWNGGRREKKKASKTDCN